jgi:hypothetical protein
MLTRGGNAFNTDCTAESLVVILTVATGATLPTIRGPAPGTIA